MSRFAALYHKILCPDFPEWLYEYMRLPFMSHLKGVGLLCGTDWTPLYSNRFFYSRFDHSVGTALITWNFTHDRKQTLASLFHDSATAAFSHVNDFRKGDALRQEVTEKGTFKILSSSEHLCRLLERDGIYIEEIADYHAYPVCDNDIPCLSADRLEYMFPSNMALANLVHGHVWTLDEAESLYRNIIVLRNEHGEDELGFADRECAELYTQGFCSCALVLQRNENKLALSMLGKIVNLALEQSVIEEKDCMEKNESEIIRVFDSYAQSNDSYLAALIKTWRTMTHIERFDEEPGPAYYSVRLDVKKRWIDPLVRKADGSAERISVISPLAWKTIQNFLHYEDTLYGAVRILR